MLVAEDFEPFRRFVCSTLGAVPDLRVICEASDGIEAVQRAEVLQPDLVLLDVGLPGLNGIDAARCIQRVAPMAKVLFLSQESSVEIIHAAFEAGARAYIAKVDAARELVVAVRAVLRDENFVGMRFSKPVLHNRNAIVERC
jgi:DNA-binding NarL/FixJ family response regulator